MRRSAGNSVVQAKPIEHIRFDEQGSNVATDFCGDLSVRDEFHDQGVIVGRTTGPDRLPRYTQYVSRRDATITRSCDRARVHSHLEMTAQPGNQGTDNGDGTISVLTQVPGPERTYGPDGKLLFTSGGTFRYPTILDHGGTPSDLTDHTFVSDEVVSSNGGKPQPDFRLLRAVPER